MDKGNTIFEILEAIGKSGGPVHLWVWNTEDTELNAKMIFPDYAFIFDIFKRYDKISLTNPNPQKEVPPMTSLEVMSWLHQKSLSLLPESVLVFRHINRIINYSQFDGSDDPQSYDWAILHNGKIEQWHDFPKGEELDKVRKKWQQECEDYCEN